MNEFEHERKAREALNEGDIVEYHRHTSRADYYRNERERELHEQRKRQAGSTPTQPADLGGTLALIAFAAVGVGAIAALVIMVTWWAGQIESVRSVLESSPLASSVAERPRQDGNPVAVGLSVLAATILLAFAISIARRMVANRVIVGELPAAALIGVTLLRTWVIVSGIALIPVSTTIAMGSDLKRGGEDIPEPIGELWAIALVLAGVALYSFFSYGSSLEKASRRAQLASG